ncbi:PAS domain-containing hybrid sensor histidine kinase/response regulator [Blautia sp. MSJ-19]|uniref:PAS domain-containing hybrid sensor histidine kinase/response regulator n=1 Tax=Blautia sp. MSJ-19 TaxID=2841517 RepID=UPI001C0F1411|nr:PAS domain-containing hybrid sensor histidine kinase/response regulator [Blautia sp. MSJ-19]MBU5481100.1 response regulator [Blautia sp. MSJ-19]
MEDKEEKEINLEQALRSIYEQIFTVDLQADTYYELYSKQAFATEKKKNSGAQQAFLMIADRVSVEAYRNAVKEFLDFATIQERMEKTDNIATDFLDINGTWHSVSFIVQLRNKEGKVEKFLFAIRNIDEEKKEELERKHLTEIRLQTMSEAIHGGFKIGKFDEKFTFVKISDQFADMLGYASAEELMEVSGGCMAEILNHEDISREIPQALQAVYAGKMYTMHYRIRCKDGKWKSIEDRGRLIRNKDGVEEVWSFIVDQDELTKKTEDLESVQKANTALENMQKELQLARDEANAANKAKSTFLVNMSHDIRTPMNAIMGFTDLALKNNPQPEVRGCLEKVKQSSDYLLALINDVLDISRIESGKFRYMPVPVDIMAITDTVLNLTRGLMFNRDLELIVHRGKPLNHYVLADEVRIREVLINIMSNAIKFTNDGGSITFETSWKSETDLQHLMFRYRIADTGIGMSKEFTEHIFDEFSQENSGARTQYQGTGLGMTIARQYVELMGGTIEVESEKGKGTTVTVNLPLELAEPIKKEEKEHHYRRDTKDLRVLMAEDNDLNAEIAIMLLEDKGMHVTRAVDGCEVTEMFQNHPAGTFDVILMDIMMPRMNGYEATRSIRHMEERPDGKTIPIIAMTANAFTEDVQAALDAGMNAHLSKPIVIDTVTKAIPENLESED